MPILPRREARTVPDPPRGGPAIQLEDLVKVYPGAVTGLAGLSVGVERGEIFGLLGPNGSGKTTAVRVLVTLLRQTSGSARVGGFDTGREPGRVREIIGYAGQFVGVDDDLTVHENLVLQGLLHGLAPNARSAQRITDLVDALGLAGVAGERARRLSGGLRRRLDLAQALVHRPAVLFLDEPTTGLDPQSRNALWGQLRELRQQGMTVWLTTQYLEEADRLCDRVAILDAGRLVALGTPASLKREVGGGRLVVTLGEEAGRTLAARALASCPGVTRVQPGMPGEALVAYVEDPGVALVRAVRLLDAEGIPAAAVEQARVSLDDVFLRYTGQRPRAEARVRGAVSGVFAAAHGRRPGRGAS
jgi:ABC-type multidrug transport system ATPase subunit